MRIESTVGSEVIHETGFDDTFYYLGNETGSRLADSSRVLLYPMLVS